jgi:hypothetical protein
VLGRPCYTKFIAIPNYTYLKIKMLGPADIITVDPTYRHSYECDVECVEYAETLVESEALIVDLKNLADEVPDTKRHAGSFEPAEATKIIPLDPSDSNEKTLQISSKLDPKYEEVLDEFLCANARHTEGGRRALLGHPRRLQTSETTPAMI